MTEVKNRNLSRYVMRFAAGAGMLAAGAEITMAGARMSGGANRSLVDMSNVFTGWGISLVAYSIIIFANLVRAPGLARKENEDA